MAKDQARVVTDPSRAVSPFTPTGPNSMAGEEKSAPAILFGQEHSRKRAGQKKDARPPAPYSDGQFPNPKQPTRATETSFETTLG